MQKRIFREIPFRRQKIESFRLFFPSQQVLSQRNLRCLGILQRRVSYRRPCWDRRYWPNQWFKGKLPRTDITFELVFDVMTETNTWRNDRDSGHERSLNRFSELLRRAYEPTALSRADQFHWNKMIGTILPFDPQGLALIATFTKKWNLNHSFKDLSQSIEASNDQKLLLRVANGIISGDKGGDFEVLS